MKRIAIAAVMLAAVVATPARSAAPTYVSHNCTGVKVEPGKIMFACADGGFYVTDLEWSKWTGDRARATGTYHMNDCKPSCAGGTFHERTGTLVLRRPERCPKIDKIVFMRARVTYDRPWRGQTEERHKLFCPY